MNDIVISQSTRLSVENYLNSPCHALLIIGKKGSGKYHLAINLLARLMEIPLANIDSLPYYKLICQIDNKEISIEEIRTLEHFLSLKVPSRSKFSRFVLIENAHAMSIEAQTALLKTLEEPPDGTLFILTVSNEQALLPTVRSRTQKLNIARPDILTLESHFTSNGKSAAEVKLALMLGGGLPGLTHNILYSEGSHPKFEALQKAKELISEPVYTRLSHIDSLIKNKTLSTDVVTILQHMAKISLANPNSITDEKWAKILRLSYLAENQLQSNAQAKLVFTNLMLEL